MRLVLFYFLLISMTFASTIKKNEDFVSVYRYQGIDGIKKLVDSKLRSKEYWINYLKNIDTSIGYYENTSFVFVANKRMHNKPNMILYKIDKKNGKLKIIDNLNVLIGKGDGDKRKEGDKITPIGAYDIVQTKRNLPKFYGPLALVTSYPDIYDKVHGRTGYGIWIHGKPLGGEDRDINTKGCIAIDNNMISRISKIIGNANTRLITWNKEAHKANKEEIASILSSLFQWKKAWESNDLVSYLTFYSKNRFLRFDKKTFDDFIKYKTTVFNSKKGSKIQIQFSNIDVMPYPNTEGLDMYKISFYEKYKSFNYNFSGIKEVYVIAKNNTMKIVMEK